MKLKNKSIALFLLAALTLNTGSQLHAGWRESLLPVSPLSGEIMWDAAGDAAVAAISNNRGFLLGAVTLAGAAGALGYMRSKRITEEPAPTQNSAADHFAAPQLTREEQEQSDIEIRGLSGIINMINHGSFAQEISGLTEVRQINEALSGQLQQLNGLGGNRLVESARATVGRQAAERIAAVQAAHVARQNPFNQVRWNPAEFARHLRVDTEEVAAELVSPRPLSPVVPARPEEQPVESPRLVQGDIWTAAPVAALPQAQQNQAAPLKKSFFSRLKKAASAGAQTFSEGLRWGIDAHAKKTNRIGQQGLLRRS